MHFQIMVFYNLTETIVTFTFLAAESYPRKQHRDRGGRNGFWKNNTTYTGKNELPIAKMRL